MPGKFISVRVHFIWSTLGRRRWIGPDIEQELYSYIGGIARNHNGALIAAGGDDDHIHLYLSMPSTLSLAQMVNVTKSNSSSWLRQRFPARKQFAWQKGYGAFSVSRSAEHGVIDYLSTQRAHHRQVDFKQEFVRFLEQHGIEYDERYLWD
jgi:putative transposase